MISQVHVDSPRPTAHGHRSKTLVHKHGLAVSVTLVHCV